MLALLAGIGLVGFLMANSAKNSGKPNVRQPISPWLADSQDQQAFDVFRSMMADPYRFSLGDFAMMVFYLQESGFLAEADMLADMALRVSDDAMREAQKRVRGEPYFGAREAFLDQKPRVFAQGNLNVPNAYQPPGFVQVSAGNYGIDQAPNNQHAADMVLAWQAYLKSQMPPAPATTTPAASQSPSFDDEMQAAIKAAQQG